MDARNILEAEAEIRRLLRRIGEWKHKHKEELKRHDVPRYIVASPESGALKRASMDVTRALAKMRKP